MPPFPKFLQHNQWKSRNNPAQKSYYGAYPRPMKSLFCGIFMWAGLIKEKNYLSKFDPKIKCTLVICFYDLLHSEAIPCTIFNWLHGRWWGADRAPFVTHTWAPERTLLLTKSEDLGSLPQEQKKIGSRSRCNRECSVQGAARVNNRPTSPNGDDNPDRANNDDGDNKTYAEGWCPHRGQGGKALHQSG